jgi:hypothetical protein
MLYFTQNQSFLNFLSAYMQTLKGVPILLSHIG